MPNRSFQISKVDSIFNILFSENHFFSIAKFQREYSWGKKEILELLYDLKGNIVSKSEVNILGDNVVNFENRGYFLGNIFVIENGDHEYQLIDGQQRITTLAIICGVIRDILVSEGHEISKNNELLVKKFKDQDIGDHYKLNKNDSSRMYDKIINRSAKPHKKDIRSDEDRNIYDSYIFINEELMKIVGSIIYINGIEIDKIEFLNQIVDGAVYSIVGTIVVSDEETATIVYNSLNSRGMPLHIYDLIKSNIYSLLVQIGMQTKISKWFEVQSKVYERNQNIDTFDLYKAFWYTEYGYCSEGEIISNFKNKINIENICAFLDSFFEYSEDYSICTDLLIQDFDTLGERAHKSVNQYIEQVKRLKSLPHFNTVLMCVVYFYRYYLLKKENKEATNFTKNLSILSLIEKIHFLHNLLLFNEKNYYYEFYSSIIVYFEQSKSFDSLNDHLFGKLNTFNKEIIHNYIQKLKYHNKNENKIENQLAIYALYTFSELDEDFNLLTATNMSIEHVIDQSNYDSDYETEYIVELGNLLPLDIEDNTSIDKLSKDKQISKEEAKFLVYNKSKLKVVKEFVKIYSKREGDLSVIKINKSQIQDRTDKIAKRLIDGIFIESKNKKP